MFVRYNLFGLGWSLAILVLTLSPGYAMPETPDWNFLQFDTFAHFFVFGILTLLMIVGFTKQYTFKRLKSNPVGYAILIAVIYGVLIEFAQGIIPERFFDIKDMIANTVGCFTGWLGFYLIYRL